MNEDERLREQIVLALDALPVPRALGLQPHRTPRRSFGAFAPMFVAIAVVLVVVLATQLVLPDRSPAAKPAPLYRDDFASGIDRTRWTPVTEGAGPTVAGVSGRVEMNIPADAKEAPTYRMGAALLPENCVARGDYVVSFDYELLDWPLLNGANLALHEVAKPEYGISVGVQRTQNGEVESVMAWSQVDMANAPVVGRSGSLRLTRQGINVTGSYRDRNGPWVDVPVAMPSPDDATFRIWFVTDEFHFGHQRVRVAVDNFSLTAKELTCA